MGGDLGVDGVDGIETSVAAIELKFNAPEVSSVEKISSLVIGSGWTIPINDANSLDGMRQPGLSLPISMSATARFGSVGRS